MVTNDLADGLVAENARLRARLDEAIANAQVYGERMLQAQNERDHAKRELAEVQDVLDRVRRLQELTIAASCRTQAIEHAHDTLTVMGTGQRREDTTAGTP